MPALFKLINGGLITKVEAPASIQDLSPQEPIQQHITLRTSDAVEACLTHLSQLKRISIEFLNFTDGRGYSMAKLLRERYGYREELRATGDVLCDQIQALSRCGFDAFELPDGTSMTAVLTQLRMFQQSYQADTLQPTPWWLNVDQALSEQQDV
jgi:uncharacterized protein (DUF934 family)